MLRTAAFLTACPKRLYLAARRHPTFRDHIGMLQTPMWRKNIKAIKIDDFAYRMVYTVVCNFL